eukprot:scaffold2296_cov101-Skeletonema_dohrnii-CCMP3373.AAC.2
MRLAISLIDRAAQELSKTPLTYRSHWSLHIIADTDLQYDTCKTSDSRTFQLPESEQQVISSSFTEGSRTTSSKATPPLNHLVDSSASKR